MRADPVRRDYLIEQAVRAGKFTAARAGHYRTLYDRDPAGMEHTLAMLSPALAGLALPDTAEQGGGHVHPVPPAVSGRDFTDDEVGEWSKSLGFAKPARSGRVTTAGD